MIGIVVVSHSRPLARAARELALEMVPADPPQVAVAAGVDDGFGTDAVAVSEAIDEVRTADGVLVLCDLGSAVLSAGMALEFVDADGVLVSPAPLVEGLVVAVVCAAGGASLAVVAREAENALAAKRTALGVDEPLQESAEPAEETDEPDATADLELLNPGGLHARPAALLAGLLVGLDARVRIGHGRRRADAGSPTGLLALGAAAGRLTVSAWGRDAGEAVDRITAEVAAGFGELGPADVSATPPTVTVTGVVVRRPEAASPPSTQVVDPDAEAERIGPALDGVGSDLAGLAEETTGVGAEILRAGATLARDTELRQETERRVREDGASAARALWLATEGITGLLVGLGGRAAERVVDLHDIRDRATARLEGRSWPPLEHPDEDFILVGTEVAPADVVAAIGSGRCRGVVTGQDGATSHAAIIAREAGLVVLTGATEVADLDPGRLVGVGPDGLSQPPEHANGD